MPQESEKQAVRHLSGMLRQCLGVRQELGPGDQSHAQEESTRHGGGDDVEIPAAHGSGDPDQSRMDGSMSGGAASSSGQGLKRTAGQARLPADADISHPQVPSEHVWRVQGLEWSQTPGDKIAGGTASTTRNDADFDKQVTDANMSSSDDRQAG